MASRYVAVIVVALAVFSPGRPTATQVSPGAPAAARPRADHVIVVTLDGLRWQEFFDGAELARCSAGTLRSRPTPPIMKRFWRDDARGERRAALMPFMWEVVARQGQVFGDPSQNSLARVTNGLWFSYPGYAEMLSGFADPRIDSNDRVPNPNVTVLEWLNGAAGFAGRVAAFGAWDVLPSILNVERSKLPAGDGYPPVPKPATDRERAINDMADDLPPMWDGRAVRRADHARGARVPAHAPAPRALRHARRDRRVGARGPLRPVSRRGVARRPVHPPAVGDGAVDAGLQGPDGAGRGDRSRPRRDLRGLD